MTHAEKIGNTTAGHKAPALPKRPREHALGDEAQDAFKRLLPSGWIYRPKQSDYGIDGEVELVLSTGSLPGRLFYVQLKGTDNIRQKEALRVRLKLSTVNYFRALDLPVLIVRYHGPAKRIFAKWFDAVSGSFPKRGQHTLSLQLSEDDEYTQPRAARIANELEEIRLIKFKKLRLPIGIALGCTTGEVRGFTIAELASAARSFIARDIVDFRVDGPIRVEVGPDRTEVQIGIWPKTSLATGTLFSKGSPQLFAANLLTAIGIALGGLQQEHVGAALIASSAGHGDLLEAFPYGIEAAFCLAADRRTAEALEIASLAISRGDCLELARAMSFVPVLTRKMHGASALQTELLRKIVAETERRGDLTLCATAQYNLANHLHSLGRNRQALRCYHSAFRADQRYTQRSYIWREIGVLLFDTNHFRLASACYERAIALGDNECRPFLADALMWSGEYDRSIAEFETYRNGVQVEAPQWALTRTLVKMVRDQVGSGTQRRNRVMAMQAADPRGGGFDASPFQAALRRDGLCGLAWFNRAHLEVLSQNYENATKCYTAAALCQRNDLESWCLAIGCAMKCGRYDLCAYLLSAGYTACGEEFSRALFGFIRNQPDNFPKDRVVQMLGEIISCIPIESKPPVLRIFPRTS